MCSDDEKKTSELGVGGTVLRGLLIGINAFFAVSLISRRARLHV